MSDSTRLNKFLAHATGMSRREADAAIAAGRVRLNGEKAVIGSQVTSSDDVQFDNKPVHVQQHYTYLLLHKPVGYLCSRRSQGGVPTIFELLPETYRALKQVGRLDKDSSGLLLLTDDGDFAHHMTHPRFHKTKLYEVELDKPLQPLHQQMISDFGVTLEDGVSQFLVEKVGDWKMETGSWDRPQIGSEPPKNFQVTLTEGRNRQIRRTFAALGYTVTKLHRTRFGNYSLDDMKKGEYRLTAIS